MEPISIYNILINSTNLKWDLLKKPNNGSQYVNQLEMKYLFSRLLLLQLGKEDPHLAQVDQEVVKFNEEVDQHLAQADQEVAKFNEEVDKSHAEDLHLDNVPKLQELKVVNQPMAKMVVMLNLMVMENGLLLINCQLKSQWQLTLNHLLPPNPNPNLM